MVAAIADLVQQLANDGWSLSYHVIDPGGAGKESSWAVTVHRNGKSFTTEFHKGYGLRHWKKNIPRAFDGGRPYVFGLPTVRVRPGQPVGVIPRSNCQKTHDDLNRLSEADPPTLDEVLHSMLMDTLGVCSGQTFEEFCGEYEYDTDSRKAERIFNACRDAWAGLLRMGANIPALCDMFRDY